MAARSSIEVVLTAITNGFEARLRAATSSVKELGTSAAQADKAGLTQARQGVDSISRSLGQLKQAAIGAFAFNAVQGYAASFIATADAMRNMDNKLLLTSKNTADYAAAQQTVVTVAKASGQGLQEVATLYTRMALATSNLNVSQQQLADVTRTVALATSLSGASTQEASAGLQQFAQAMAANRLGGDELGSVLENMPMLTKVFVDAAGGSIAKLREMAKEGELTTQWMIDAIAKAKDLIEKQAEGMPLTVGRAMTGLKNDTAIYIDSVNQATGLTTSLAGSIQFLGKHLDEVAKGGLLVMGTGLSLLVGQGLAAARVSIGKFIADLGAMSAAAAANTVAVSTNAAALSGYGMATTATAATGARMLPMLLGLVNPITAITTVLGLGATAWMIWGQKGEDAVSTAKKKLAELERLNQMMKEQSNPGLKEKAAANDVMASKLKVAKLEKELAEVSKSQSYGPNDGGVSQIAQELDQAQKLLAENEKIYQKTQENITLSAEQRGAKEVAVEMSVTDAIREQDKERRKITASKLENDLAEIQTRREAALKGVNPQFKGDDLAKVQASINARFDTEAAQAKKEAADKAAKAAETAANKAERAAKKEEAAALRSGHVAAKVAAEKLRISTEGNLLALEQERIEAQRLPTALARAEAEMDIARRSMAEKIALATAQAQVVETDPKATEADKIKAKREILKLEIDATGDAYTKMAAVAQEKMSETEQAWRRGTGSVEDYRAAVEEAKKAGVLLADQASERMISSGNDMGAALSLGFQRARERMQTDAEVMIYLGEHIGEQVADGLVSAWDSFISSTKSAKEAMIDFARSTLSWIGQVILKQMILNALKTAGMFGGAAGGGAAAAGSASSEGFTAAATAVGMLANGGSVRGWSPSPTADNIPTWLTAREFVQPVRAVDHYGIAFMESIRRLQFPKNLAHALAGGTMPRIPSSYRLAQGGSVPGQPPATTVQTGDTRLKVINVIDKNMVGDYMKTHDGETAIINMIRRNGSAIRAVLR